MGHRQFSKCMIESDFPGEIAAEAVGFSQRQFELVVEPLDDAVRKLFSGLEIVQQKPAMTLEGGSHFLERVEPALGHARALGIEELAGPSGRHIGSEVFEAFHEHESPEAPQPAAHQLAHPPPLFGRPVAPVLQERPAHPLEQRGDASAWIFGAADLVDRLGEIATDVKAIQNVQRLRQAGGDHAQIGLPHIRAGEAHLPAEDGSQPVEEHVQVTARAFFAHPQQPSRAFIGFGQTTTKCFLLVTHN